MINMDYRCAVIFGGTGFIGSFFADYLISNQMYSKVYLYDIESKAKNTLQYRSELYSRHKGKIDIVIGDVCDPIKWRPTEEVTLIANFAAVHREPGHVEWEYFKTNLKGAENVTAWASEVGCLHLIFTSSISPYGISESEKDETTLPVPVTAYGSSKLVAEKIHLVWQSADALNRKLLIVRPGVVFGPSEGGNVSRMIKAISRGYFFYIANHNTRKAGIYVKELCNAIWWVYELQLKQNEGLILFNGTMNPGPSISEYVEAIRTITGKKRFIPNIPYSLMLSSAYFIDSISKIFGISHPFSPVRIRKLVRSNNIVSRVLADAGYQYIYNLDSSLRDWKKECPEEWS
jgi:GlcNAc-P-P-Und epimerase